MNDSNEMIDANQSNHENTLTHEDIIRFMLNQKIKEEEYQKAVQKEQNDAIEMIDHGMISDDDHSEPEVMDDEQDDIQDVRDSLHQLYAFKDAKEEASYDQMKKVIHEIMDNYSNLIAERRYRISAGPGNYKQSRIETINNSIRVCENALGVIKNRYPEMIPEITPYDFNEEIPINEKLRAKKEAIREKSNNHYRHLIIKKLQEMEEIAGAKILTKRPISATTYFPNENLIKAARDLPYPEKYKKPSIKKQYEKIKKDKIELQKEMNEENDTLNNIPNTMDDINSIQMEVKKWFSNHWKKEYTEVLCSAGTLIISATVSGIISHYTGRI